MDLAILTTIFCFISLVLGFTALTALSNLKLKVNAHLDRTDLHTEKLKTILSILQQIEAKQDLMFNNAPPVPGEESSGGFPKDHWILEHAKEVEAQMYPQEDLPCSLPYYKGPLPIVSIPLYHDTKKKPRKPRKDAGVKRAPYKKATAQ